MSDERKMEKLERLLRAGKPHELSPGFKRSVMDSISRLPAPVLLAKPRGISGLWDTLRRLGTGEKLALGIGALGLCAMALPGVDGLLAAWNFELADTTLSLTVGDLALSASAMSLAATAIGGAFLAVVGAYSARHHLLGA
ncbi:hypothetical protein IT575_09890 [bacterium]|nr:hypothetical protein [bacterium]